MHAHAQDIFSLSPDLHLSLVAVPGLDARRWIRSPEPPDYSTPTLSMSRARISRLLSLHDFISSFIYILFGSSASYSSTSSRAALMHRRMTSWVAGLFAGLGPPGIDLKVLLPWMTSLDLNVWSL
jgi:hypothetical protein